MILLKVFYRPLSWDSSPSFIPVNLRFVPFIVSPIFWMFSVRKILDLTFSFTNLSIFLSFLQCPRLFPPLVFSLLFTYRDFYFPEFPWSVFSELLLLSFSGVKHFYLSQSNIFSWLSIRDLFIFSIFFFCLCFPLFL